MYCPYIQVDGEMLPCCAAELESSFAQHSDGQALPLVNLLHNSLKEIWNAPGYKKFRLAALENRYGLSACRNCCMSLSKLSQVFDGSLLEYPKHEVGANALPIADLAIDKAYAEQLRNQNLWHDLNCYVNSGRLDDIF